MTKLHILSDLHVDFDLFTLPDVERDVLVIAGDTSEGLLGTCLAREWSKFQPVVMVAGNHEFYGQEWPGQIDRMKEVAAGSQLHVLENEQLVIAGVRFLGCTLWTDFALFGIGMEVVSMLVAAHGMSDYYRIKHTGHPLDPQRVRIAHDVSVAWLKSQLAQPFDGPTVVISHHAPSAAMLNPYFRPTNPLNPAFASNLDRLFGPHVDLWISGHTHYNAQRVINGTRLISNCRGYPGDEDTQVEIPFDPGLVLEV